MPASDASDPNTFDVVILGGGLAGGCLARQLRMEAPQLRVLVVEKRRHPVPEAAFKSASPASRLRPYSSRNEADTHLRSGQHQKLG